MYPRRWLVVALLLGAGVVGALALRSPGAAGESPSGAATPLWSARRTPSAVVDPVRAAREVAAGAALRTRLLEATARFTDVCFVVERGGRALASEAADVPLIPASTQKLLVAAAALHVLGPDHRFETRVVAEEPGSAIDRLWVVGGGDPVIRTAPFVDEGISTPLDSLADAIADTGVRRVGVLEVDDARYDAQRYVPTWKLGYLADLDVGPLGALSVDQGVTFVGGRPVLVEDPGLDTGARLAALLRDRGVTVGDVTRGRAPSDATPVARVTSQPLRTILRYMLGVSDNVTAELLTKELGVRQRGEGSTVAGTAAIRSTLGELGMDVTTVTNVDGSGLDRGNRLSCADLVAVLDVVARPDLGGLRDLLPGGGAVRAKSGYLDDVTGLAGTVDGSGLAFAVLLNGGVPRDAGIELGRIADVLAAYEAPPQLPDTAVPVPVPVDRSGSG
jgi:D-alanyl-D-alanine carboxypeptidase/D-alanyl-D-alanine-endopeptidase (penicillin-binding protein 4)